MDQTGQLKTRPKARRPVGPGLKRLLFVVFGLFALLAVNSTYLSSVTALEWLTGQVYQNWFYLLMFLLHLVLGLALILPVILFGIYHIRNTYRRRNRRAIKVGYALFVVALLLLGTGIVLTRLEGIIEVKDPTVRGIAYWIHVIAPLVAAWLFVLHRLAGKPIRWRVGAAWAGVAVAVAGLLLVVQTQDPRQWNVEGNPEGEQYFFPSLSRTLDGNFIEAEALMKDAYCQECHADIHADWMNSVHKWSSFNNPPYLFSVRNTRDVSMELDGNVNRARFCAGCHDPVPFFSGRFNDPDYDDVNDPTAHAGITCTVCHSITHVNSQRGNGDYTIQAPVHYPFVDSESSTLQWVNRQLVKAKPAFHKKTFLKPLHQSAEFCGSCHKVHLPEELNDYKWLRGQNHYDSFLLSGVSGSGVASFYYPPKAEQNCNGCHMPLQPSEEFGAQDFDASGALQVHNHQFPSANTALPYLVGRPQAAIDAHYAFNEGVMRVDLFGVKEGGTIEGDLIAPLRPQVPALERGKAYLLETIVRTVKMGHLFTQGTADSNQVWLDVRVVDASGKVVGRSGAMDEEGFVDPWSHFLNAFVIDREGKRIDRRNAEDIFVALYNNQIPPGAADVVHFRLDVPADAVGPLRATVALRYRKFDTAYMRLVQEDPAWVNDLPVMTLAEDSIVFPLEGAPSEQAAPDFPLWQRWNDYGIGLLRKQGNGQLREAEQAFAEVERLGRPDGAVNRARVYLREGRITQEAPEALRRAAAHDPPAPAWTVLWLTGQVNQQNGRFDEAIENYRQILEGGFEQAVGRGFDFNRDYRLLNRLGQVLFERGKQERGEGRKAQREAYFAEAVARFQEALRLDPENVTAHYNLRLLYAATGQAERADFHAQAHARYKPDDNARDRAIAAARRAYPAANRAAEAVVVYDLRPEPRSGEAIAERRRAPAGGAGTAAASP